MAIVGMSSANTKREEKTEIVIRPDTTWYDPSLCRKCPYLEMDDVAQIAKCHKPYRKDDENCLGESMLVQAMLTREHYLMVTKQLDEIDAGLTEDEIANTPKLITTESKRKNKRIKLRRGGYL